VQARYYNSARLLKWCDEERRPKEKKKTASRKKPLKLKGDQYGPSDAALRDLYKQLFQMAAASPNRRSD
jgi:hypothetical protein